MALQKQPVTINFSKGIDTKIDPFQVPIGTFLRLQNSVFDKLGRLTKRNGYGQLTALPEDAAFLTTFQGNLTAIGSSLQAYAQGSNTWIDKGNIQPVSLSTLSLVRSNTTQTQADSAVSSNNFICTVYTDVGSGSTRYRYVLADSRTGQNVLPPANIPSSATITSAPRVFILGSFFVIMYGTATTIRYCTISTSNPVAPLTSTSLTSQFTPDTRLNWDGVVANNALYVAWNGSDGGGAIRATFLDHTLQQHNTVVHTGHAAALMGLSADNSGVLPKIYISWWQSSDSDAYTMVLDSELQEVLAPTLIVDNTNILNLTSVATDEVQTVYYEVSNNYSYDSAIPSHFIRTVTCTEQGVVGTPAVLVRSIGLASEAFTVNDVTYFLGVYQSPTQPTYYLISEDGQVISQLAYSNGGGYHVTGLSGVTVSGDTASICYQFKDLIAPVNKAQGVDAPNGVYAQTGLNQVTFTLGTVPVAAEIGSSLQLTGGFLWMYDGYIPVEQNFFLWPDSVEISTSTSGGSIEEQQYFYQVVYEWTDNQGNIHRSAPSIPVSVTTTGGDTSTNTINVPTLRLTYKLSNPVKIVIYRWSVAQQVYYQVTSVTSPLLNNPAVDSVAFVDTFADSSILGNSIIYTTGGVIENTIAPAMNAVTIFDSRLWGINAEDQNLLWYSKQVIENTPVEMSDLFTLFVAPTIAAQGSTGNTKCIAPMDDKLILFKRDAMYYINGTGPDNTGANSSYSQPTFIASTVGCENQQSIVFTPKGLMFQSDKGIWLLDRGLTTSYIGAPVEDFTLNVTVRSAINVPGTNQIRFTMSNNVTLMYDYFVEQWGVFVGAPAISSTLYQNLHTYIDIFGRVFQETIGAYLDGSNPVLQAFSTGWIGAAGLTGYQRAYFMHLLGTYLSPHKLNIGIAYDYEPNVTQYTLISPDNYNPPWGTDSPYGGTEVWGGPTNTEEWQIFFERQKCQSFQITIDEIFDPSYGTIAGPGLTLSGINLTIGVKKGYPTLPASRSAG